MQKAPLAAALGLLLVVSGLGAAAFAGVLPSPLASQASNASSAAEPVEVFSGEVPANFTDGFLDLRVLRGNILVETWNQSGYEIAVYQTGGDEGYDLGDSELEITFDEYEADGAFGLLLEVTERGTATIQVGGDAPEIAVVAKVPDLHWREAYVCSAGASGGWTFNLGDLLGFGSDDECVADGAPVKASFRQGTDDDRTLRVPFEVRGLRGGELTVAAEYADLTFENVTFTKGAIATEYGGIDLTRVVFDEAAVVTTEYGNIDGDLAAPDLKVDTEYGEIDLVTRTAALAAASEYGDVRIAVTDVASGKLDVSSEYGNVVLAVPRGPGYDVHAETEYGKVRVSLANLSTESAAEEGEGSAVLMKGLDLASAGPGDRSHGDSFDGRTEGYDSATIQVEIDAVTEYGNVLITDAASE